MTELFFSGELSPTLRYVYNRIMQTAVPSRYWYRHWKVQLTTIHHVGNYVYRQQQRNDYHHLSIFLSLQVCSLALYHGSVKQTPSAPTHVRSGLRLCFSLPLSALKAALRRWQICQCQQTAVFSTAGSGRAHSVTHTPAARTEIFTGRQKRTPFLTAVSSSLPVVCPLLPLRDPVTLQPQYTPIQNAVTTPVVFTQQTQPMNAQPQSRPVSARDYMIVNF